MQVSELKFLADDLSSVYFKTGHGIRSGIMSDLMDSRNQRIPGKQRKYLQTRLPEAIVPPPGKENAAVIQSMMKWMPTVDAEFYKVIFK